MKATWHDSILAQSDNTVVIEGNHYFPPESVNREFLSESSTHTVCPWKGTASYYNVAVTGNTLNDAAWYYPEPKPKAEQIRNHVAFDITKGINVTEYT